MLAYSNGEAGVGTGVYVTIGESRFIFTATHVIAPATDGRAKLQFLGVKQTPLALACHPAAPKADVTVIEVPETLEAALHAAGFEPITQAEIDPFFPPYPWPPAPPLKHLLCPFGSPVARLKIVGNQVDPKLNLFTLVPRSAEGLAEAREAEYDPGVEFCVEYAEIDDERDTIHTADRGTARAFAANGLSGGSGWALPAEAFPTWRASDVRLVGLVSEYYEELKLLTVLKIRARVGTRRKAWCALHGERTSPLAADGAGPHRGAIGPCPSVSFSGSCSLDAGHDRKWGSRRPVVAPRRRDGLPVGLEVMRCRWSEFSPAESCAFEVVAGQFLCERHLRFALQRAREAGPKPKSSLIARYRDKYIERLLIVAATLTVERLEEIVEHLGAIAFSGTEDGDVVIETPDGQQVKLPPLPADTGAPGGRDEARGLDELYHRVVRSVVSLDGDEDRLAREWSRIPDHVKRMMAEITGTRVRVQFLTGMPGMPHDFEEALNRLTDEEIDGLLHHWGIPGMRTGAAVDQRLRDEQILRPENLGAPALTQHGDHVAQIARLRRNLPLPDRFVTASELERRNKRGS